MRKQIFEQPDFIPIFDSYESFSGKAVGLTGASGVLGSIIHSRLKEAGVMVFCYEEDITNPTALSKWFDENDFDFLFHFAAIVPVPEVNRDPLRAFEVNSIGTFYLCKEVIKKQKNCRIFLASSSHVYNGDGLLQENSKKEPISIYGKSKLLSEELCIVLLEHYKISYSVGRIFSFTHVLQNEPYLVPSVLKKIEVAEEHTSIEIHNPDSIRDILDAETVVDCILFIVTDKFNGIVNIGSGEGKKIIDITKHIANLTEKKVEISGKNINRPNSLVADVSLLKKILSERNLA